ncbi:MAG: hypothetical protein EOO38_12525 [Cytophagaceae bacterium]|nr:MAG: hypothetical protein EOO38_12525 [Cytophagaceae bacterium]
MPYRRRSGAHSPLEALTIADGGENASLKIQFISLLTDSLLAGLIRATTAGCSVLVTDKARTCIAHAGSEMAHALRLPALLLAYAGEYSASGRN